MDGDTVSLIIDSVELELIQRSGIRFNYRIVQVPENKFEFTMNRDDVESIAMKFLDHQFMYVNSTNQISALAIKICDAAGIDPEPLYRRNR